MHILDEITSHLFGSLSLMLMLDVGMITDRREVAKTTG